MSYYCTRCEKDVEICPHKSSLELDFHKMKSTQMENFAIYWEEQYNKLKKTMVKCYFCREKIKI